jgi:RNA polymerase sigma-70 factor (ECF subfamily)
VLTERSNDAWIAALSAPGIERNAALEDLRERLVRGLHYALSQRKVRDEDIEDFAQDALLKILKALDTFRAEAKFTTWAQKVAVRVAFSELRRRRWRNVSLDEMTEGIDGGEFIPMALVDPDANSEQQATQRLLVERVRDVIDNQLTDKQRAALVAMVIHGVPPEEIGRRMGTNRNAVYKLLHDARKRLKQHLLDTGLSHKDILDAFET